MESGESTLIPCDLPENLKAVYRNLVSRENDVDKAKPPVVIVTTTCFGQLYNGDFLLALTILKELRRLGLIKLRGIAVNVVPDKIGFQGLSESAIESFLKILGLDVSISYENGSENNAFLFRLLKTACKEGEKVTLLCLSSPLGMVEFSEKYPAVLSHLLAGGKVVFQDGYPADLKAHYLNHRPKWHEKRAGTNFYKFLREKKIPSIVFDRDITREFRVSLTAKMFDNNANTEVGRELNLIAKEENRADITWTDALASASVIGDEAMLCLGVIKTPFPWCSQRIHQEVGSGREKLNVTGDGMCLVLEALFRGSLLTITQRLPSKPQI